MIRPTALFVAASLLAAAGCRYCANPYDYCNPLFTGKDGTPCAADSRAGSLQTDQGFPVPSYGGGVTHLSSDEKLHPVPDRVASGPVEGPAPSVEGPATAVSHSSDGATAMPQLFPPPQNPHRMTGYTQPAPWLPQR